MKTGRPFLSRADDSLLARWWWTTDRSLLLVVLMLLVIGVVLSFSASPAVAERLGLPPFHFAFRQLVFAATAFAVILLLSMLDAVTARRLAIAGALAGLCAVGATLLEGDVIKGARRWLDLGIIAVQPTEFLKPCLMVTTAWLLAGAIRQPGFPGAQVATVLVGIAAMLMLAQPDVGQTLLLLAAFSVQLLLFGVPLQRLAIPVVAGMAALIVAYLNFPHVSARIDAFLARGPDGHGYQVETALKAIRSGGVLGVGPAAGTVKKVLPDAHTDFIFAAAGEEFGLIAGLALIALYATIVLRLLARASDGGGDAFAVLAAGGLAALLGLQAAINIGVNLAMLPPKGMTLPFVSYGGSSALSSALTLGLALAFIRREPDAAAAGWGRAIAGARP
ncbi:MAG: cell division protein FtsW [Rhodothalassiaceae bacterium]|nr:MAG: cell division protein FtsW [Rhodothalassiaceae bacterium]